MSALRPIGSANRDVAALQQATQEANARAALKGYARSKPFPLTLAGGGMSVRHGLGRKPAGWLIHSVLNTPTVYVVGVDATKITVLSTAVGSCVLEVW